MKKSRIKLIKKLTFYLVFIILFFLIIATGNKTEIISTKNVSNVKSIKAVHLVSKYNPKTIKTQTVTTFEEILSIAASVPVKFNGTMTGYGPDCVGCGGKVGCPPRQNVTNGNIYFKDQEYGTINIVATDRRIPCGTIIKITNSSIGNEITAIALDRGGVIKGTLMDFLVETEAKAKKTIGRQNVTYEIVRWGW